MDDDHGVVDGGPPPEALGDYQRHFGQRVVSLLTSESGGGGEREDGIGEGFGGAADGEGFGAQPAAGRWKES